MNTISLVGAIKATGASGFEGWASTTQLDRQGDIVLPEAFAASLPAFRANGPIFWNHAEAHDPLAMPIGKTTDAEIREGGLYIKARWASHAEAQTVRQLVMDGIVGTLSIGYNEVHSVLRDGVNFVDELELMEVSVVPIPANTGAIITAAKTLEKFVPAGPIQVTVDGKNLMEFIDKRLYVGASKAAADDDVSVGAQILSMLADLKDEESDDPEDAALLQTAIDAVLAWLASESAEIGTGADDTQDVMAQEQENAPVLASAKPKRTLFYHFTE